MITIGIDVSKVKIDCLWLRDVTTGKVKSKVFKNTAEGHSALLQWAMKNAHVESDEIHFVMEATGIYHEALAYTLYDAGSNISVVNPAKISSYGKSFGVRSKTDKKDSWVIAHFGATQQPLLWQPEPSEIRTLKALISRHDAVSKDIQRESNRLEKATISGISNEIIISIETILMQLKVERKRLENLINQHLDQHPNLKKDRALLESIPGIGPILSRLMIGVIRSRNFTAAPQCAAFVGVVPVQFESGSSVRGRSRLSKAGDANIRAKLYMAAVVAIQHNPDIKQQYERLLKNGKSKMSAIGAAMRKLVQICFGVLKHQTPYQSRVN